MIKSVLIATPGRCGSHWLMAVLADLLCLNVIRTKDFDANNYDDKNISVMHNLSGRKPTKDDPFCVSMEHAFSGLKSLENKINIIIMIRDPRDICVSVAYYNRDKFKINFESVVKQYFEMGIHNPKFYRAYAESHANLKHYLIREAIQNPSKIISGLLDYFKYDYESEHLDKCINRYSFDVLHERSPVHFRKGVIGNWKNHMTETENKKYCETHKELMETWGYCIP
jgi:hypothetical protein